MAGSAQRNQAKKRRRNLGSEIRRLVLIEAGYRCGVPTCRQILALDIHHMVEVSEGGDDSAGNLIALCPTCHALYHRGDIDREAIQVWKGILVSLNQAFDGDSVELMLFLWALEQRKQRLPVTLDGMLRFSSLVSSGLAEFDFSVHRNPTIRRSDAGRPRSSAHVVLTAKGRSFIQAWRSGDRSAVERVLGGSDVALETDGADEGTA